MSENSKQIFISSKEYTDTIHFFVQEIHVRKKKKKKRYIP